VKLTSVLYNGGAVSGLDVDRAQTQLASTRSQLLQTRAQRDLLQHAIAALVGQSASSFALSPQTTLPTLPVVPVSVPSTLLQRRPDIAAAERLVAADNAQIGVARAAFFPSLTLSAGGGVVSSSFDNLLSAPNRVWSLGPSMLLNVVDGGQRRAALRGAHADEAAEHYRSVALAAFQQVEDQQSRLADFGSALVEQNDAVTAADRTLKLSMGLYKQGADDYLDVVTAQVASLQAHLSLLGLQTDQLRASIQLVRALGGGWQDTSARRG
jgi:NodT family efflux transporter outer membrane factor (OMF) lipoprotein